MQIRAFHGLRYGGEPETCGRLAAPPYDQIDDDARDRFHEIDGHFVHLTRPVARDGADGHERSAALHRRWRSDGVVVRDDRPALYANSIELPSGQRRFGLTALIDVEPPASGVIRPHEETVDKTVAERLALLRTTALDYEPILVLADDDGTLDGGLEADCSDAPPLAVHRDEFGNVHRSFRIDDPRRIDRYRAWLGDRAGLIADGHHRYKTASLFAEEIGARRGSAAAAKLAVITSLASTALAIDPIHRALPTAVDPAAAGGTVRHARAVADSSGESLAQRVAAAAQPSLAVLTAEGAATLLELDPAQGPTDLPPAASELAVVHLHAALLPAWGFEPAAATDGTLAYRSDPESLWQAVTSGTFATGIFLPPMDPTLFAAAIADGDILPPKSTRFLPKVVSGLVWAAHADPVE